MNHNQLIHYYIQNHPQVLNHVVDMTAGNGHDTYFLAQHCQKVSAIDIQAQAITQTKARCSDFNHIDYYQTNHQDIATLNLKQIDGAMFNLGYLPKGDKDLITNEKTTLVALDYLVKHSKHFISIACYIGHEGGLQEQQAVKAYLDDQKLNYHTICYLKDDAPITYIVDFNKKSSQVLIVDALRKLPQDALDEKLKAVFY